MIPVLNGGEHLALLLKQIIEFGKIVVVEGADGLNEASEHRSYLSVDMTREIIGQFENVIYSPLGKSSDPRNLLNKGLQLLDDVDFIFRLDQSDYILDIERLMHSVNEAEYILAKRKTLWIDFEHFFTEIVELGFRNFDGVRYSNSLEKVQLPEADSFQASGYQPKLIRNVVANLRYVTSFEKRRKILMKEAKLSRLFSNGIIAAKNTMSEHIKIPDKILQISEDDILREIEHPWRNKGRKFFESLPVFPSISDSDSGILRRTNFRVLKSDNSPDFPKALGWNCPWLKSKFEAEGWQFSEERKGKFDLIYSVNEIPSRNELLGLLRSNGKLVVIDADSSILDQEFEIEFLEKKTNKSSFTAIRRYEL